MRRLVIIKILLSSVFFFMSANLLAQENAEKLELLAMEKQKVMTIASQREAIKLFTAAKLAYTYDAGKQRCDNGIETCNRNIKIINGDVEKKKLKEEEEERKRLEEERAKAEQDSIAKATDDTHVNVYLDLSATRLDFKGLTKKNDPQKVEVRCNYDDWEVKSESVNWLSINRDDKFLLIEAKVNEGDERSYVIEVYCGEKNVKLVVNQDKMSLIEKKKPKKKSNYNY